MAQEKREYQGQQVRQDRQVQSDFQDRLAQILRERISENLFVRHLGIEFLELAEGYARARMPYKAELLNPYGFIHGGCLYSLADIVAGNAACMSGRYATTVSGIMNYLEPAVSSEFVYCEAGKLRVGAHLAVFEVRIWDERGKLLDSGEFTFFLSDQKVLSVPPHPL